MNDLQAKAVVAIMKRYWGGHMQTGVADGESDAIFIYTKMGPNLPAIKHIISVGGHIATEDSDWDGKCRQSLRTT